VLGFGHEYDGVLPWAEMANGLDPIGCVAFCRLTAAAFAAAAAAAAASASAIWPILLDGS
jgi:hypothetical protein